MVKEKSIMTKTDSELLEQKRKLNKQLDKVNNELAEQQHEKDLKEWVPVSMQEFYEYMADFAKYTMEDVYEPWEFSSEDMGGIIEMALKAGIRPDNPDVKDKVLTNQIKLADEAREALYNKDKSL
ncbi:hypothetical protein HOU39_gp129 [Lactobacillus phage Iacchus]|uniref:Uncharacterized protein n=1 Tax=Lactobacillus phage Iacchus TaxID=2315483 RepID=A0A3S7UP15_9CAUD|nr:hypothetical protein HOU39_gp129 [Lactobacillus phage Iacchus]AYH92023.1 hypothetical protein [Lactobacillus phage Iacchus]AYH92195.1 hypothetical protein [Lactobacillus phage Dionysus]